MPSRKKNAGKKWSLRPELHDSVSCLLEEEGLLYTFYSSDDEVTYIRTYDTRIMGYFRCHNATCTSPGWFSKRLPITIRLYSNERYNARVYHQQCKKCHNLSRPTLDDSYAERVAYRIKKWDGVDVEKPPYSKKKRGPPHERELCEGCKAGHCKEGDLYEAMAMLSI